jgi:hypothetical protein
MSKEERIQEIFERHIEEIVDEVLNVSEAYDEAMKKSIH